MRNYDGFNGEWMNMNELCDQEKLVAKLYVKYKISALSPVKMKMERNLFMLV